MTEIKKAKCCGTCKHWKPKSHCYNGCEPTTGRCKLIHDRTDSIEVCDKHEWSENEDQES